MKPREYEVLSMAVEIGVRHGWRRAHKHNESPEPVDICEAIEAEVCTALCEWFHIDDGRSEES